MKTPDAFLERINMAARTGTSVEVSGIEANRIAEALDMWNDVAAIIKRHVRAPIMGSGKRCSCPICEMRKMFEE